MRYSRRGRDVWAEYHARVEELKAAGQSDESAKRQAYAEREAKKKARASELAAEKKARSLRALHCQICARDILADTGLIAHHGYERPGDGWQTESCPGARELPYENNRDKLGVYIAILAQTRDGHAEYKAKLEAESIPMVFTWDAYDRRVGRSVQVGRLEIVREGFDAAKAANFELTRHGIHSFDDLKARNVAESERLRRYFAEEHTSQKKRFDTWRKTRVWNPDKVAWEVTKA